MRLRTKLKIALGALMLLVIGPAVVSLKILDDAGDNAARSRLAHEVLEMHLVLAERGHRLVAHIENGFSANDATGRRLLGDVDAQASRIRQLIAQEISIIGKTGAAEEDEELERIDAITTSLRLAASGANDDRWLEMVDEAVAEERRETMRVDRITVETFRLVDWLLLFSLAAAVLIGGAILLWLQRSITLPIQALLSGTKALSDGELGYRIDLIGDTEFLELGRSFNEMAGQIASKSTALEQERETLEQTVLKRTAELEKANVSLSDTASRRSQFLADISHELRTPLAIIRGEAEVTLRGKAKPPEEYRASLAKVNDQVQGMVRLVDDLLYVARAEAGAPKLKVKAVDLGILVKSATLEIRTLLEEDGGSIAINQQVANAKILGDADRLHQVIRILIDNAIHYSDFSPVISIDLMNATDGYALIVHDQGLGISAADLPHVFDRYHRGKNSQKAKGDGMGLGLPLAKAIVEDHGGTITIESTEGEGTSVRVFLPRMEGLREVA